MQFMQINALLLVYIFQSPGLLARLLAALVPFSFRKFRSSQSLQQHVVSVRVVRVEKFSAWPTGFSVFSRIQEKTLAKPFEVCQLSCPEPGSPKSPSILMQPRGDSTLTEHNLNRCVSLRLTSEQVETCTSDQTWTIGV